ncbi:MAG: hypothetical protein Q7S35_12120 [Candidatus Limnocylindrales bacterium]|nr:hypothetical protein [Candidatus Limnocylindrales bacterium]
MSGVHVATTIEYDTFGPISVGSAHQARESGASIVKSVGNGHQTHAQASYGRTTGQAQVAR